MRLGRVLCRLHGAWGASLAPRRFALGARAFALFLLLLPASSARADIRSLAPTLASASLVAPDSLRPRCRSLECVRRRLRASTTVRLAGEFGRFAGHVNRWDADSLAGFEVDPDWSGDAPAAPLGWSQIARVDQRVTNSATGAVFGAMVFGLVGGLFAVTAETAGSTTLLSQRDSNRELARAGVRGVLIGGALGALFGAEIGSKSNHWVPIYRRP